MLAVIYCRISVARPEENSLNAQETIAREFIQRNRLVEKYVCRESGSAYTRKTAKLEQIITNEKNIVLIIKCVDRFSRNVVYGKQLLDMAWKNRIQIVFVQEQIIFKDVASGNKVLACIGEAEKEVKRMTQRIRDINKDKRSNGLHIGGSVPYGFAKKRTHLGNKLVLNQYESKVVKLIIFLREDKKKSLVTANALLRSINNRADPIEFDNKYGEPTNEMDGYMTYTQIAELLNEYNITKRGEKWKSSTINSVHKKFKNNSPQSPSPMNMSFNSESKQMSITPGPVSCPETTSTNTQDEDEMVKMFREFQLFKKFMSNHKT